ncbi:ATPase [Catellatospora methionotrophica]|uniref:histidine kinase n=1 Tax=Catellatospora methionotrophica TaxID=121620 RepID=A0A8J3LCI8_9ACTN|nr:sensor histidine kinase [Catellatospora methionotrophica]GIG18387.1 ATPase [Catellatospora methionotrophica]
MPLTPLTQHLSWWKPAWWTPLRADAALAAGLFGVQVMLAYAQPGWRSQPDLTTVVWSAVTLLPVVVRRTHLWLGIAATAAFTAAGMLWPESLLGGQGVALWVLAYTAAAYQRWWRALLATALLWLVNDLIWIWAYRQDVVLAADGTEMISMSAGLVVNLAVMVITFLIGRTVRARREASTALAERALAAESSRQAHAEQAVAEERRRIARELHDVVAHHVSVIGVMSTGARRMLHRDPAAADEALATIEQTSRTTLRELRRLLFVLRSESAGNDDADRSPQPGLSALRTLVEQVCEAGVSTSLRVDGDLGEVDPGVALTAYRIVQEALTNALKHAGPARAQVRLAVDGRLLTIEVFDTGRGPHTATLSAGGLTPGAVTGHGLLGMRERVAVYGGTLRTGPRPGGGFRVHARIPIEQAGAAGPAVPEAEAEVAG